MKVDLRIFFSMAFAAVAGIVAFNLLRLWINFIEAEAIAAAQNSESSFLDFQSCMGISGLGGLIVFNAAMFSYAMAKNINT